MKTLAAYAFGFFAPVLTIGIAFASVAAIARTCQWYVSSGLSQPDAWRGAFLFAAAFIVAIVVGSKVMS